MHLSDGQQVEVTNIRLRCGAVLDPAPPGAVVTRCRLDHGHGGDHEAEITVTHPLSWPTAEQARADERALAERRRLAVRPWWRRIFA